MLGKLSCYNGNKIILYCYKEYSFLFLQFYINYCTGCLKAKIKPVEKEILSILISGIGKFFDLFDMFFDLCHSNKGFEDILY